MFAKGVLEDLVDDKALQIQDEKNAEDLMQNLERLANSAEKRLKSESRSVHRDGGFGELEEVDERETGAGSDDKDEVQVSMMIKEDVRTTVDIRMCNLV